jgi:hypothetical protein
LRDRLPPIHRQPRTNTSGSSTRRRMAAHTAVAAKINSRGLQSFREEALGPRLNRYLLLAFAAVPIPQLAGNGGLRKSWARCGRSNPGQSSLAIFCLLRLPRFRQVSQSRRPFGPRRSSNRAATQRSRRASATVRVNCRDGAGHLGPLGLLRRGGGRLRVVKKPPGLGHFFHAKQQPWQSRNSVMSLILFSNVLTTWDSGTVVVKLLFYLIICCHMCLGQCGTHSWDTWDRRGFANRPKCLCGSMGADRVVSQRKCLSLLYWCSIVKTGYRSHHAFGRAFCLTGRGRGL